MNKKVLKFLGLLCICLSYGVSLASQVETSPPADEAWHDPTMPLHRVIAKKTADAPVVLSLSAILDIGGKRSAVINGTRVEVGSVITRAQIIRINASSVVYSVDGKNYTLNMRPSLINP